MLGAVRSGWRRGFTFYVVDLVGFSAAVLLAVRFHKAPAHVLHAIGLSKHWSPVAGGLLIFVPLIALTAVVGSRASKAMYKPGLFTLNRVLGAAVAAVLAITIIVVGLLFVRSVHLPFGVGDLVKRSVIARRVIREAAPGVAYLDHHLGLDLCGGRLAHIVPEVCREASKKP